MEELALWIQRVWLRNYCSKYTQHFLKVPHAVIVLSPRKSGKWNTSSFAPSRQKHQTLVGISPHGCVACCLFVFNRPVKSLCREMRAAALPARCVTLDKSFRSLLYLWNEGAGSDQSFFKVPSSPDEVCSVFLHRALRGTKNVQCFQVHFGVSSSPM